MPENPANKPYAYDRCHELGLKPGSKITLETCAELALVTNGEVKLQAQRVLDLAQRLADLETQLTALTGAKEAAKPAITT